jgi:hypothetical protein
MTGLGDTPAKSQLSRDERWGFSGGSLLARDQREGGSERKEVAVVEVPAAWPTKERFQYLPVVKLGERG